MGNQCQNLTEVKYSELLKLLQKIEELFDWNTWHLGNRSNRLRIIRGCEANMFDAIFGTKGTLVNFEKGDLMFSPVRSP